MFARRVTVVGDGYVGLSTGTCLASLGHRVTCAVPDRDRITRLRGGEIDLREPGLPELIDEGLAAGRLAFAVGASAALAAPRGAAEVVVLASGCALVTKSTVPVGTAARIRELLGRDDVPVVANPGFLREGSSVHDFLHPDRIVVGCDDPDAAERVAALYSRLGALTVLTDPASAELVKYAADAFLALKPSYVNALAERCERLGADVRDVTEGIGQAFLSPGPGWGGATLPKDTQALLAAADAAADFEFRIVCAAIDTNTRQLRRMVDKVRIAVTGSRTGSLARCRIRLLGLAFKAGTDDVRDSPAPAVAVLLRQAGAELVAYDPPCAPTAPTPSWPASSWPASSWWRPRRTRRGTSRRSCCSPSGRSPARWTGPASPDRPYGRSWWTPATCSIR